MFSDVHPSETGARGEFFRRFATPKPGDVKNERIRCAMCGFPFRYDDDTRGDSQDSPGIAYGDEIIAVSNNQSKLPIHLQGLAMFSVSSKTIVSPTVGSGCRLCGTYNPIGAESREFDTTSKDMSGR